jgi:hypothetical protein
VATSWSAITVPVLPAGAGWDFVETHPAVRPASSRTALPVAAVSDAYGSAAPVVSGPRGGDEVTVAAWAVPERRQCQPRPVAAR